MAMNVIVGLAIGIIMFALMIGVGVVVMNRMAQSVAGCGTGLTYNTTSGTCDNSSGSQFSTASAGAQELYYMEGQTGTSGLASWTPAIIALAIGLMFIGALIFKGRKY